MSFFRLVAHTVGFVLISIKKGLHIVLDVAAIKDIHFGVSVNFMLVPQNMKLSTAGSVGIFRATCLWNNLTQSMDRKVL